ncbi:hypothetical protein NDU88_000337 [Pleurodeles waltl]|uniref:Uncharacterized protein n=1 Tax=Pleurodeles waltl TaxID=8319 RepID=A0AAV7MH55_PLEWA|nr:hypothetical protein NDU88_000337 [Pleurodeles waltl]
MQETRNRRKEQGEVQNRRTSAQWKEQKNKCTAERRWNKMQCWTEASVHGKDGGEQEAVLDRSTSAWQRWGRTRISAGQKRQCMAKMGENKKQCWTEAPVHGKDRENKKQCWIEYMAKMGENKKQCWIECMAKMGENKKQCWIEAPVHGKDGENKMQCWTEASVHAKDGGEQEAVLDRSTSAWQRWGEQEAVLDRVHGKDGGEQEAVLDRVHGKDGGKQEAVLDRSTSAWQRWGEQDAVLDRSISAWQRWGRTRNSAGQKHQCMAKMGENKKECWTEALVHGKDGGEQEAVLDRVHGKGGGEQDAVLDRSTSACQRWGRTRSSAGRKHQCMPKMGENKKQCWTEAPVHGKDGENKKQCWTEAPVHGKDGGEQEAVLDRSIIAWQRWGRTRSSAGQKHQCMAKMGENKKQCWTEAPVHGKDGGEQEAVLDRVHGKDGGEQEAVLDRVHGKDGGEQEAVLDRSTSAWQRWGEQDAVLDKSISAWQRWGRTRNSAGQKHQCRAKMGENKKECWTEALVHGKDGGEQEAVLDRVHGKGGGEQDAVLDRSIIAWQRWGRTRCSAGQKQQCMTKMGENKMQ